MSAARTLRRGHKRLKPLIDFALRQGWEVVRTPGGHLKFTKPGLPPIYTGSTAGDHRASRNASRQPQCARSATTRRPTQRPARHDTGDRRRWLS